MRALIWLNAVARHCGSEVKEQSYHSPPPLFAPE